MNIGEVQEYTLEIGKEKHIFRMDFTALMKFSKRYEGWGEEKVKNIEGNLVLDGKGNPQTKKLNAIDIFNKFINTPGDYEDLVKILSCACIDKDFSEEELLEKISFDFPTMYTLDRIVDHIIQGSIKLDSKEGTDTRKNS